MQKQFKSLAAFAVIAAATVATPLMAAEDYKESKAPAASPNKGPVGTTSVNRYTQALINRIDANKDGKVTKEEFMKFMEAEFNALDKDKSGMLETSVVMNKE